MQNVRVVKNNKWSQRQLIFAVLDIECLYDIERPIRGGGGTVDFIDAVRGQRS